jgi:uncharacterized protein (TIGR03435 family)
VHDQTDLTGPFDLTLEWSAGEAIANDRDAPPSVFTALQEQLGLKLEPIKAPVESIVVDQLQRIPTEN